MAYTTEELEKMSLDAIANDPNIVFLQDVIALLPVSSQTFYNHGLEKFESIKSALQKNRVAIKSKLRFNWLHQEENATMQISLYKLLATDEEKDALTMQRTDLTSKGEQLNSVIVEVVNATKTESN